MSTRTSPVVIALLSALGAAVGGLLLLLVGVIVEEVRNAKVDRKDLRLILREHMTDKQAHHGPASPAHRRPGQGSSR